MTLSPNEHLTRAETLIERMEAVYAGGREPWTNTDTMKLAELHVAAATCRAVVRMAFTQQHVAAALLADEEPDPTDETGDKNPWETSRPQKPSTVTKLRP